MMLIVAKELPKGITNDPSADEPWVMRGNTDYTHFMIPVDSTAPNTPRINIQGDGFGPVFYI